MKNILYITLVSCIGLTIMISCSEKDESSSSSSSITEDITISSSASDNATVVFGQTYQHQVTTSGTYSGTVTYSLSNEPDNMTISASGLIEWTPSKGLEITTHSNITITITTASGYVLTQTYDLTVTGTCVSGNVLSIWTGDQRSSTDSSKFLANITAYTDNASDNCGEDNDSDCTPAYNYDFNTVNSSSENLHIGPTPSATKGNMFFYNQYDNTSYTYLFWMFGKGGATLSSNDVDLDVFVSNNASPDENPVDDDVGETDLISQSQSATTGLYTSSYTGRYHYNTNKSDGAVIGPFSGSSYRIFIDLRGFSTINSSDNLTLGNLESFTYWSKDGFSLDLEDNESNEDPVDNFTVGYNTTLDCSN
jgi:hypothetical protein